MADFFTAAQLEALGGTTVRCDLLVKFEFATADVYAWNGTTDLVVGGNTYKPMFGAGEIDGLALSSTDESQSVTIGVSGLPEDRLDILALALEETPEAAQRLVTISLQLFDEDWQPVGTPIPLFWGFMQPPVVQRTQMQGTKGAEQTITITAENVFYNRSKPPFGRYTDRDQQARYSGDKFFGFTTSLVYKKLTYPDF